MVADAATPSATEHTGRGIPPVRFVAIVAVYVAAAIFSAIVPLIAGPTIPDVTPAENVAALLGALLWLLVLIASMVRQPDGPLWKLILAYTVAAAVMGRLWALDPLSATLVTFLWNLGLVLYVHMVLAFPSGHLHDRFDRWLVGIAYVVNLAVGILAGLTWTRRCPSDGVCVDNLLALAPNPDVIGVVARMNSAFTTVFLVLALASLWRHWRTASTAARRALLPIMISAPLGFGWLALSHLSYALDLGASASFDAVGAVVFWILPIGLLLGVLRIRLGRGRIADLVVQLGRGVPIGGLRDLLARAVGDPTLELAFAAPSGTGFVDATGRPLELPQPGSPRSVTRLEGDGHLLALLIHDPAIDEEDPELVEAAGNAARLALENERLAAEVRAQLAEVRASRARIVETGEAERRRIERDLHDGAQQRLVALAIRLQVAKETNPDAADLLDEATVELETAVGDIRDLARGLHPTILSDAGLAAAVQDLAERASIPVRVDVDDRRYPGPVEGTAYFVITEAVTNVERHASATEATVTVHEEGGRLVLEVADDGVGGAVATLGSGLRGLDDRVAAAGGRLSVSSPQGVGTTIRVELPLA